MADPVKALTGAIAGGRVAPVYVLYGDEPASIHAVVDALRELVIPAADATAQSMAAFNHERFDGAELSSAAPVLEACAQMPMLARYRLVELANVDDLGGPAGVKERAIDALVAYLGRPSPTTVLVIHGAGIDGRSKLVNAAKKAKEVVLAKFEGFRRDEDASAFVSAEAQERQRRLGPEAAYALVAAVGTGRSELLGGLERVLLYVGERAVITADDVHAVIAPTREVDVFAITDAVGRGDHRQALILLARIFAAGERDSSLAHRLFALLLRQIRLVITAKAHEGRYGAVAEVPPFLVRKIEDQARGFSMTRLRAAYAGLARLDYDLKGGSLVAYASPYLALQRWVLETCDALPGVDARE